MKVLKKSKNISFLVMDVDGTLTDGKIYMGAGGELLKCFDIKDGYGIANILPRLGIVPIIITGRKSKILEQRCAELKIEHVYQGISDKVSLLNELLKRFSASLENVAYIGDDLNDIECMRIVGLSACPQNAVQEVQDIVDYCCKASGGDGAVREFIDYLKSVMQKGIES